jgi:hypothetical protein
VPLERRTKILSLKVHQEEFLQREEIHALNQLLQKEFLEKLREVPYLDPLHQREIQRDVQDPLLQREIQRDVQDPLLQRGETQDLDPEVLKEEIPDLALDPLKKKLSFTLVTFLTILLKEKSTNYLSHLVLLIPSLLLPKGMVVQKVLVLLFTKILKTTKVQLVSSMDVLLENVDSK